MTKRVQQKVNPTFDYVKIKGKSFMNSLYIRSFCAFEIKIKQKKYQQKIYFHIKLICFGIKKNLLLQTNKLCNIIFVPWSVNYENVYLVQPMN